MSRALDVEICILAGGLSTRMGRDKSRLRLGRYTMLGLVRRAAASTGQPVRVIRRDLDPRCGPLGGIYTALKTTHAARVLFLPCDMPFVSGEILNTIIVCSSRDPAGSLFVRLNAKLGFPFVLSWTALELIERQIEQGQFSLQALARKLRARIIPPKESWQERIQNINTPEDMDRLRRYVPAGFPPVKMNPHASISRVHGISPF